MTLKNFRRTPQEVGRLWRDELLQTDVKEEMIQSGVSNTEPPCTQSFVEPNSPSATSGGNNGVRPWGASERSKEQSHRQASKKAKCPSTVVAALLLGESVS